MDIKKKFFYYSGGGYHANVSAWLNQGISDGGTSPSAAELMALSEFITALEGYGLLARMKTGNIMHLGSKEFAKINIKNPSTYKFTESGTVTFSVGNGCRSASNSYFNQPFKSNEYSGIQNDLTSVQYISESSTTTGSFTSHGFRVHSTTAAYLALTILPVANRVDNYHYQTAAHIITKSNHKGLYIQTRSGGNSVIYHDGTKSSAANASVTPDIANNRFILAYNNSTSGGTSPANYYTKYVAVDFLFDVFNDTDASNFKTAFDTYKTAVGLP